MADKKLFYRDIKIGDSGDDVQFLLAFLWREHGDIGLEPDWVLGKKGAMAIGLVQTRLGLPNTGIFCVKTRQALREKWHRDFDAIPARP